MNGLNLIRTGCRVPWVAAFGFCTLVVSAGARPTQPASSLAVAANSPVALGATQKPEQPSSAKKPEQGTGAKTEGATSPFGPSRIPELDSASQGGANQLIAALDAGLTAHNWAGGAKGLLSLLKPEQTSEVSLVVHDGDSALPVMASAATAGKSTLGKLDWTATIGKPASSKLAWSAAVGKPASSKLSTLAVDEAGQIMTALPDEADNALLPHGDLGKFGLVPTSFYSLVVNPSDEEDVMEQNHLSDHALLSTDTEALIATVFGEASNSSDAASVSSASPDALLQTPARPVRGAEDVNDFVAGGGLLVNNAAAVNLNASGVNLGLSLLDHGMMTQMTVANQGGNSVSVRALNVAPVPEPSTLALIACFGALTAAYAGFRKVRVPGHA